MMQNKDTKTLNLDKDFEERMNKAKQAGWNESSKTKRIWIEEDDEDQQSLQRCTQTRRWESIVNFVAEWFFLEEMKVLQGVSVLTSVWAREWQYDRL